MAPEDKCERVVLCGVQVVQSLRDKPKAWHLGYAGALISQEREYKALHEVKNMQVSSHHRHNLPRPQQHSDQIMRGEKVVE